MAGYNPLSMHSINIGGKNTWTDWHLIAEERPSFARPSKKTNYVDIPGLSGSLNFSDSLTGYPTYNDREGSWTFKVSNDYWHDGYSWSELINEIADHLDETKQIAILEDDEMFFYVGSFELSEYKADHPWGTVIIKYRVNPYKWSILQSTDDWLWDPFRFDIGVIQKTIYNRRQIPANTWLEVPVNYQSTRSRSPICPHILVESENNTGVDFHFINPDLKIDTIGHLDNGDKIEPSLIVTGNNCKVYFKKKSTVSVVFRSGEL